MPRGGNPGPRLRRPGTLRSPGPLAGVRRASLAGSLGPSHSPALEVAGERWELALAQELAEGGLAGRVGAEHLDELGGGSWAGRTEQPPAAGHQVLVEDFGSLAAGQAEGREQIVARLADPAYRADLAQRVALGLGVTRLAGGGQRVILPVSAGGALHVP